MPSSRSSSLQPVPSSASSLGSSSSLLHPHGIHHDDSASTKTDQDDDNASGLGLEALQPQSSSSSRHLQRKKGILSRKGDKSGPLISLMSENPNPKQLIQSMLQMLTMWFVKPTSNNSGDEIINMNEVILSLMNILNVGFLELMYAVESANEQKDEFRPYDEDEFVSKFCEGSVYSFIENLRDHTSEKAKRLIFHLQTKQLNQLRKQDTFSSCRLLKLRADYVHNVVKIFEFGTLMYYIGELKCMKSAFDYTLYYFRNSSLCLDPNFREILLAILDTLILQNFNAVLDAAREVDPSVLANSNSKQPVEENSVEDDVLEEFFLLKKNQSLACIKRLEIANKMNHSVISPELIENMLTRIQEDFECIEDILFIFEENSDKLIQDESEVLLNLKNTILSRWKDSWEHKLDASYILDAHTALPTLLNTAIPASASTHSTTNIPTSNLVKYNEWLGIFPECDIFDNLRKQKDTAKQSIVSLQHLTSELENDIEEGWMKDTATDPVHVLTSMQRSIEALHCHLQSSRKDALTAILQKEEAYKENIKIARIRRQASNTNSSSNTTSSTHNASTDNATASSSSVTSNVAATTSSTTRSSPTTPPPVNPSSSALIPPPLIPPTAGALNPFSNLIPNVPLNPLIPNPSMNPGVASYMASNMHRFQLNPQLAAQQALNSLKRKDPPTNATTPPKSSISDANKRPKQ
ncbi:hypothetical protein C9374_004799 [Naegleria lovaniensis]|uniref:Uncharacterized protein n=1 Tax=Naegleria lovaniensis TaxID=51637 RepID=A0AA88KJ24_NAELO|nr:uncharacterized protein C9374_004799 [Naegleria lovaniensis]KAG2382832.1 hypothetical protein C9374_004799 [Naegleria lovaniensis]